MSKTMGLTNGSFIEAYITGFIFVKTIGALCDVNITSPL